MRGAPMERRRKNLRHVIGILKDKASLVRTALLFSSSASSSSRLAVLRATSHDSRAPRVGALIALGQRHRRSAAACVDALMDRLHRTRNACVALKCLIVLHGAAASARDGGSSALLDQLAAFPSSGGRNFLNLSAFRDESDPEMSAWVRWFAGVLEQSLTAARVLGEFERKGRADKFPAKKSSSEILKEMDSLGNFVEQVSDAPESLHLQRSDLVYEVVILAADDYGLAQREIALRVEQLGEDLSPDETAELTRTLQRLEDCKERLGSLLVNRKRNDGFWGMIGRAKVEHARRRREREERRIVVAAATGQRDEASELTRFAAGVAGRPDQLFRLPAGGGSSWLDNDRMALTVSAAG